MGLRNFILIVFVATELFSDAETMNIHQDRSIYQNQSHQKVHFSNSDRSHETLIVFQDYYKLEFQYQHRNYIPLSLINLLEQSSVASLLLQMGYINPSSSMFMNKNQQLSLPIYHGIALFLQNKTKLTVNSFQSIAQVFSISRSSQFMLYLDEISRVYANNPNDKFCAQHLKVIIDTFMPCKTVSGIGALVNENTFFLEKDFFGLQLQWNVQKGIRLAFYIQKNIRQIKNFIRMPLQKRNLKRCMHFDRMHVIQKFEQNYLPNKGQTANFQRVIPLGESFSKSVYFFPLTKSSFRGKYYHPQKVLKIEINFEALLKNQELREFDQGNGKAGEVFESELTIKQMVSRIALPKGFQVSKIESFSNTKFIKVAAQSYQISENHNDEQLKHCFLHEYLFGDKIVHNTNELLKFRYKFDGNLYLSRYSNFELNFRQNQAGVKIQNLYFYVFVHYLAHLKPFEQYQTSAGGGQEFMNLPTLLITTNKNTIVVQSIQNSNMFDRLLEPDFSIPFHTLTFTTAIFGYLWISIWKALYRQIDQEKMSNMKEKQLEHKRYPQDQKTPKLQTNSGQNIAIETQKRFID